MFLRIGLLLKKVKQTKKDTLKRLKKQDNYKNTLKRVKKSYLQSVLMTQAAVPGRKHPVHKIKYIDLCFGWQTKSYFELTQQSFRHE